jgi:hypothetical protein
MGQTLGLALLVSLAKARTMQLLSGGSEVTVALTGGYHIAYFAAEIPAAIAGGCGVLLKPRSSDPTGAPQPG